jgi:hypothetical protein
MRVATTTRRASIVAICLIGIACGGGSEDATPVTDAPDPAVSDPPAETVPPAAPSSTDPTASTQPPTTDPPTTTTTEAPAPEPVSFDLATLPELIALTDQATTDPTVAPLSLAQQWIGFPYEIPVPDGSTLFELSVDPRFSDDATRFTFTYDSIAPGGMVPDIDIALDGNGPGSVEIIETWDPIMADLGFERRNSTGSDPGDPGGPNSVNHVYTTDTPAGVFNGVAGEVAPIFIWSTEDINGWSYSPEREELAGYSIDVDIDTAVGAGIPVPLVNALLEQIPLPDGLELSDAGVDLRRRSADSFDVEKGLLYVDVSLEWQAPADQFDAVVAFFADPSAVFADEATLMAGGDDFFNGGTIERSEWYTYGEGDQRLELLLLQRYGATFGIDAGADGTEPMTLFFDLELNPEDQFLELPTG